MWVLAAQPRMYGGIHDLDLKDILMIRNKNIHGSMLNP
jgi:hypothetical protein